MYCKDGKCEYQEEYCCYYCKHNSKCYSVCEDIKLLNFVEMKEVADNCEKIIKRY